MNERLIATPHGSVAVVDYGGDGPDIVLLHGAGRTLADWGLVLPHLKARRVVATDFRWHGLSSDEGDVGLEANADDVEAVVAELQLKNPAVIGHSLGGMTAEVYGGRHPECPGVVNLDGHGTGTREEYEGISDARYDTFKSQQREFIAAQREVVRSGDDRWREDVLSGWGKLASDFGFTVPPEVGEAMDARSFRRDEAGTWHLRPHRSYSERLSNAVEGLQLFDFHRQCEAPLLIYNCTKFLPVPGNEPEEFQEARRRSLARLLADLAAQKSNVRIRTLDASHMMIFDHPELVAEDILAITR